MSLKVIPAAAAVFISILLAGMASAQSFPPHFFRGSVTVNGAPAPDGTVVAAFVNGIQRANTTTAGGVYGKAPANSFYVEASTGAVITFFVSGVNSGKTASYCAGCFNQCGQTSEGCADLDLAVTVSSPPSGSGGSSSGGGGSGGGGGGGGGGGSSDGGGGGGALPQPATVPSGCQERWLCSEWGECVNGVQRRTCSDANNCGTNNNEPFSVQPCETSGEQTGGQTSGTTVQQTQPNPITAFLVANPAASGGVVVVFLGLVYGGWRLYRRKIRK